MASKLAGVNLPESIRAISAASHALKGHSSGVRRQIAWQQQSSRDEHMSDANPHSPETRTGSRSNTNSELARTRTIDRRLTPSQRWCCEVLPYEIP